MKPLLRLTPYLWRYRKTLFLGLGAVIASNIFYVLQPLVVGRAVDALQAGSTQGVPVAGELFSLGGMIVGLSVIGGVFSYLTRQTIIVASRHIEFDLRNDLLAHLQKLHYAYFQNTPTGDLMAHATNDIASVRNVVGPGIMYPADTLVTLGLVLTMMVLKDWQLTLLALVPMPLVSVIVYRLGKLINRKFTERQEQFSLLTTRAQENLSGIRVIKAYVREAFEIDRFRSLSWEYLKKNLVLARVQSILWPLMFVLVGFSLLIVLYLGGVRVIEGRLTIGSLTAFMAYLAMLIWPMIAFGWVTNLLQQGAASMKRLAAILDTPPAIADGPDTDAGITTLRGTIEFRNVTFVHKDADTPALQDITLKIEPGTTLAIVGYTGSGKSTLVNLIPRLYDVTSGQVLIDGTDVRRIPLSVLRSHIGYVTQETFLFSDTIAENIRYGTDDGTPDRVREAVETAHIKEDILAFPKQLETLLGERGITLSGGQKQRTSIARAIMRRPAILILDDALSAVDTYTEERILRRLKEFMRSRTSIIISHRISTVKDADLIVVLDGGRIVERGTHDELIQRGGIYADLHQKQLLEKELEEL
jgi:ATP-binding cassette subfamily B protein